MTVRRLAARDLEQVVRTNLERLEPLLFRTQLHRIRGRTLRTESLDRSNARDLAQVVRILREVDVSPVSPSSTIGCEQKGHQHLLMSFFVSCVVEFEKAETQAFLALSARLFKSLTAKFEPSSSLNAFSYILTSVPTWSQISF